MPDNQPRKFKPAWVPDKPKRTAYEDSEARKESSKFYHSKAWRELRQLVLSRQPLCVDCLKADRVTLATQVHHIIERKERPDLAFDIDNLESCCVSHHNQKRRKDNFKIDNGTPPDS